MRGFTTIDKMLFDVMFLDKMWDVGRVDERPVFAAAVDGAVDEESDIVFYRFIDEGLALNFFGGISNRCLFSLFFYYYFH